MIGAMTFKIMLLRCGCSEGRYHMEIKTVTAGMRRASKPPRRKRQMKRPPNEEVAAMQHSKNPQHKTLTSPVR